MKDYQAKFITLFLTYGLSIIVAVSAHCPVRCRCYENKTVNCNTYKRSRHKLHDIPSDIPTDTVFLSLRYNDIKELRTNSFQNLHQLQYLSLARCNTHMTIEVGAFNGLEHLETLDLSSNNLHHLPRASARVFQGLNSLKVLYMRKTLLAEIPSVQLSPLTTLQTLSLSTNGITNNSSFTTLFLNFTELRHLDLSGNEIGVLSDSFFINLRNSPVSTLDLSCSKIEVIGSQAFTPLTKLDRVMLSGNQLRTDFRHAILSLRQSNVSTLILQSMEIKNISQAFVGFSNLRNVDLAKNNIVQLESHGFSYTNHFKSLNFTKNPLSAVSNEAFWGLIFLEVLDMRDCRLLALPAFASVDKLEHSLVPNLQKLHLDGNSIKFVRQNSFRGLSKTVHISFAGNSIVSDIVPDCFLYLSSVKSLDFNGNHVKKLFQEGFRHLSKLEVIDIGNNPIAFQNKPYFSGRPSLVSLKMPGVNLHKQTYLKSSCLFRGLFRLKHLDLHDVQLKRLPSDMFQDLQSLVYLRLSGNMLHEINPVVFSMLSLARLDVSSNQIQNINQSSLQPFLNKGLNQFEAHYNPYACTCDLQWYTEWLRTMIRTERVKVTIRKYMQYKCATPKQIERKNLLTYDPTFLDCYETPFIIGTSVGSFAVLVIIVVTVGYHYRWYIRYWLFLFRSRFAKNLAREDESLLYKYDCFVTYCEDDMGWVLETLRPKVEDEFGFRVCLQDRDFELGKSKVDNIDEAIQNSRKILIVLTTNFAMNSWCNFELSLAHANCLENDIKAQQHLIIMMMEDVSPKYMTPILRYLVRKRTYIEWTGDEVGQNLFWQKLPDAIRSTPCNQC